jgi:CO/xanthine dehydrogenase FAD-binding subunit
VKPAPFEYVAVGTVAEAVGFLSAASGDAKVLAGGQSLVPLLNM